MEIIAFSSGKGGTGKTLMASCLGYALVRSKQRVLFIDADPATDGLSLFLLGTQGTRHIGSFDEANTFVGFLHHFSQTRGTAFEPRRINRSESNDLGGHGVIYDALISGKGLYGDEYANPKNLSVPDLSQTTFRNALAALFERLRKEQEYDYVLIDTRGGFAFESTDVCALADSFIVVTEPDFTSFYQDRNLVRRISAASEQLKTRPLLRSIIVNKATDGISHDSSFDLSRVEVSFRLELLKEFKSLQLADTHPIPADLETLKAYKTQRIPYLFCPDSSFSFSSLTAFREILQVVTAKWTNEQVAEWNKLVESVSAAVNQRDLKLRNLEEERKREEEEVTELRKRVETQRTQIELLTKESERLERSHERELKRVDTLVFGKEASFQQEVRRSLWSRWRRSIVIGAAAAVIFPIVLAAISRISIPYKIYLVASADADRSTLGSLQEIAQSSSDSIQIAGVPVQMKVEVLADNTPEGAIALAKSIVRRGDALLVISYSDSQTTEASAPWYLRTRPQIPFISTTATDQDLLVQCKSTPTSCFDKTGLAPFMQLAPTNQAQAAAAVNFAWSQGIRRFLVVEDDSPSNLSYSSSLAESLAREIEGRRADDASGKNALLTSLTAGDINPSVMSQSAAQCIVYAGGAEGARLLLGVVERSKLQPMIILSDASLRQGIGSIKPARVYITYPETAQQYSQHTNSLVVDGITIAKQLIGDLDARGLSQTFRLKSTLHIASVTDARSHLVELMQQNLQSRSSYLGTSGNTYVFKDYQNIAARFHVLKLEASGKISTIDPGDVVDHEFTY